MSDTVLEHNDGGQHLDIELCDEEGATLGINSYEAAFLVFTHDFVDVHVDNLASLKVFVEESDHDIFCLGHGRKEFFFSNLLVGATAHRPVNLFFLVVGFHGFVASFL